MNEELELGKDLLTAEQIADEQIFLQLCEQYRIKASSEYDEHDWLLYRDGIGFSPRGNIMIIAAEKKAGKTWMGMSICAAVLSGGFLGMTSNVGQARVIFFDTEQDPIDGQRIQRRIHYAMRDKGWLFNRDEDRFMLFHLREINAAQRLEFVQKAIRYFNPDLVFIDGIRDLLRDFNNLDESANVIQNFMTLSSECNCAIWTVLHVNPGSEKMRGHLGTEAGNKVADLLFISKEKDPNNEDVVTYKVEETDSRGHKDIRSIRFRINDDLPYGIPEELTPLQSQQIDQSREDAVRAIIQKYMPPIAAISKTRLRDEVRKGEYCRTTYANNIVNEAIKLKVIERVINGKYRMVNRKMEDGPPDVQSEAPF